MTRGKDFKQRVRERMRKTGETYTAARRHLLGQREGARRLTGQLLVSGGPQPPQDGWALLAPWRPLDQVRLDPPIGIGRFGFAWTVPRRATRADQQGRFVLDAVGGKHLLLVGARGCGSAALELDLSAEGARDQALEPVSLAWEAPARLPLQVRAQGTAAPLAGRTIRLTTVQQVEHYSAEVSLDLEGKGELTLRPGSYELAVESRWEGGAIRSERVRVELTAGVNPPLRLEVTTPAQQPSLEVEVLDLQGRPVEGALVARGDFLRTAEPWGHVRPRSSLLPNQRLTGPDGVARFEGLRPGACSLLARSGFLMGTSPPVYLERADQRRRCRVILDTPIPRGHARLSIPDAPAGASFNFLAVWTEEGRRCSREEEAWALAPREQALEGRGFTFLDLPPGPVEVSFWAEEPGRDGPGREWGISRARVTVTAGETAEVELGMSPSAELRVQLLDPTGAPLQGAAACVRRVADQRGGTQLPADGEGRLRVGALTPDVPCALQVTAPGWATHLFEGLLPGPRELTLRWPAPGPVLRVVGADGLPVRARADVSWSGVSCSLSADAGGLLRFAGDGAPLTVRSVQAEGWSQVRLDWTPPAGQACERTVILPPRPRTGRIMGRVVDPQGQPLPGVRVITYVEDTGRSDTTGADGAFRLDGLLPGRIVVRAELGLFGAFARASATVELPEGGEVEDAVLVLERLA